MMLLILIFDKSAFEMQICRKIIDNGQKIIDINLRAFDAGLAQSKTTIL
jgi:hypothetical protein